MSEPAVAATPTFEDVVRAAERVAGVRQPHPCSHLADVRRAHGSERVFEGRELSAHGRLQVSRCLQSLSAALVCGARTRRRCVFQRQPCAGCRARGAVAGDTRNDRHADDAPHAKVEATRGYGARSSRTIGCARPYGHREGHRGETRRDDCAAVRRSAYHCGTRNGRARADRKRGASGRPRRAGGRRRPAFGLRACGDASFAGGSRCGASSRKPETIGSSHGSAANASRSTCRRRSQTACKRLHRAF